MTPSTDVPHMQTALGSITITTQQNKSSNAVDTLGWFGAFFGGGGISWQLVLIWKFPFIMQTSYFGI